MNWLEKYVSFYLEKLRAYEFEEAFHGLSDLNPEVIPILIRVFRGESDRCIRSELVQIISEIRSKTAIPFLKEVSTDPEPEVWRSGIDGLVASGEHEALIALREIKSDPKSYTAKPATYVRWIEDACEQLEDSLRAELYPAELTS